jgi:hypothetical protein
MVRAQLAQFADLLGSGYRRAPSRARLKAAARKPSGSRSANSPPTPANTGSSRRTRAACTSRPSWGGPPLSPPQRCGSGPGVMETMAGGQSQSARLSTPALRLEYQGKASDTAGLGGAASASN